MVACESREMCPSIWMSAVEAFVGWMEVMKLGFCYSLRESFQDAPWIIAPLPSRFAFGRLASGSDAPMRTRQVLALVFICTLVVLSVVWWGARRPEDPVAELAFILGDRRFIEPRLTGGFAHAPCTSIDDPTHLIPRVRCSEEPSDESPEWRKLVSAIRSLERSGGRRDAQSLHRSALSALVWPQGERFVARAVFNLEKAAQLAPDDGRIRNDLAAALYVLAQERDEPVLLIRALAEISEAARLDPTLLEVRFNRALILDRLFLVDNAKIAWNEFFQLDEDSKWTQEASGHLATIALRSLPNIWMQKSPDLHKEILGRGTGEISDVVTLSPQSAREFALENLLGSWGEFVEQGRLSESEEVLRAARVIGMALYEETGESSIGTSVAVIDRASHLSTISNLAAGHRAFRDGMLSFRALATSEAKISFERAVYHLGQSESPAAFWAMVGLARIWAYDSRYEQAEASFVKILYEAERNGSESLVGWIHWGLGWIKIRDGRLTEALQDFQKAGIAYASVREDENLAAIESLIAENLSSLGQESAAWNHRYRALSALARFPTSLRRHIMLLDCGRSSFEAGLHAVALVFRGEDLQLAQRRRDPILLAEAHWSRSIVLGELDRVPEAMDAMLVAEALAKKAPEGSPRKKLTADILEARSSLLYKSDPAAALTAVTSALAAYQDLDLPLNVAHALLVRAKMLLEVGRKEEAETDLRNATGVFEEARKSIGDRDPEISFVESIQVAYDQLILLNWLGSPEKSLAALERARCLGAGESCSRPLSYGRSTVPEGITIVAYAVLEDRLLIWVIGSRGLKVFERPISSVELETLVVGLVSKIKRSGSSALFEQASSRLRGLLIPEAVEDLPAGDTVYLIPDRSIYHVPFSALWNSDERRFLIERFNIVVSRDLRHRGVSRKPSVKPGSVLWAGNPSYSINLFGPQPELPFAGSEVKEGARWFENSLVLMGEESTRERILQELSRFEMFVFAGHAFSHSSQPSQSHLLLAPSVNPPNSGLLLASDLESMSLERLKLVVLSACSSIGPRRTRSYGLSGMAGPFLNAGVQSVVGSLWRINDRRTAEFLSPFYREIAMGTSASSALRRAQIQAIHEGGDSRVDLSIWAAFEVVEELPFSIGLQ